MNVLVAFFSELIYYYIPCLLGSFLGCYIRKERYETRAKWKWIAIYAFIPTVLCVSMHSYAFSRIPNNNSLLGAAIVSGILGKDITNAIVTLRNLFNFFVSISGMLKSMKSNGTSEKINALLKLAENEDFINSVNNISEALSENDNIENQEEPRQE